MLSDRKQQMQMILLNVTSKGQKSSEKQSIFTSQVSGHCQFTALPGRLMGLIRTSFFRTQGTGVHTITATSQNPGTNVIEFKLGFCGACSVWMSGLNMQ